MVPLCAIHKSLTLSGCAFSNVLLPIVEYRTCPITDDDAYSFVIALNSDDASVTSPIFLNGGLFGTASPQAS